MELGDFFYLSGEEIRALVSSRIIKDYGREFSAIFDQAPKIGSDILKLDIDGGQAWEFTHDEPPEWKGAIILMTGPFVISTPNELPITAQIFVYIASPKTYVYCHNRFGPSDALYSYSEQIKSSFVELFPNAGSAYLGIHKNEPFNDLVLFGPPGFLYTGFNGNNEWMILSKPDAQIGSSTSEKDRYFIFYINPQTLGK